MTIPLLSAKNIKKNFYNPHLIEIIKNVDLQIYSGESVAITGRSGQGKSTLLQILGTLDTPCEGSIEVAGKVISLRNRSFIRNKHLAFIFQSFHLLEDYSAIENILMPAKIGRQNTSKGSLAYERACSLLEQVGLSHRKDHLAKLLSGGEKQRIAIARAFSNDPDIIFADEPSGNLDKETAHIIHNLLLDFPKKNKALILVTHDHSLAQLCSTHYTLQNGSLEKILH